MISLELLVARYPRLDPGQVQQWLIEGMVRAEPGPAFTEMDVARVGLILELRDELDLGEAALPVVLSLLDQLYALRRELAVLRGSALPA